MNVDSQTELRPQGRGSRPQAESGRLGRKPQRPLLLWLWPRAVTLLIYRAEGPASASPIHWAGMWGGGSLVQGRARGGGGAGGFLSFLPYFSIPQNFKKLHFV